MGQQQDGNGGADDGGLAGLPGSRPAPGRGGTRRAVLAGAIGAAAVTAAGWTPALGAAAAYADPPAPPDFPAGISLPSSITDLVAQISTGAPQLAPTLGTTQIAVVGAGLISTLTYDIWGWSKDLTLYVRPSTPRVTANGYAILTSRANIQRVVNEFCTYYRAKLTTYQNNNQFPMNGPVEIRVTGLDAGGDVQVPSAGSPQLSALRPRPDHPEWDVAVWLDILTVPGTPYANQFYREVEAWVFSNYSGSYAAARPEWSKGWGYTNSAAWADPTMIGTTIPNALRAGQAPGDTWDTALATLDAYDPSRIFSSPLLDTLAP
jgi:FAD/FMN-containing dehydrogenase